MLEKHARTHERFIPSSENIFSTEMARQVALQLVAGSTREKPNVKNVLNQSAPHPRHYTTYKCALIVAVFQ